MDKQIIKAALGHEIESPAGLKARVFQVGIPLLIILSAAAFFLVRLNIADRTRELEKATEKRVELLANSRAEVISTWLAGLAAQGDRIIQSEIFRLYAAEIDLHEEDVSIIVNQHLYPQRMAEGVGDGLAEQLPMMTNLLSEFVQYSGFLDGRVINRNGQSYIATDSSTIALSARQKDLAQSVFSSREIRFAPLRSTSKGMVLDIYLPILPPHGATDNPSDPVAVLMLSKIVAQKMDELLAVSPLFQEGERARLVQVDDGVFHEIVPWAPSGLLEIEAIELNDQGRMAYGVRRSVQGDTMVYSLGQKVPELDWWVVQETDYESANGPLRQYRRSFVAIAVLGLVALVLLLGAAWWRLIGVENKKIAVTFKELAGQIENQRQFLDSINSTITDYIGFKDHAGNYQYVNPAFARAVDSEMESIIGSDDRAVFGYDTAKRLQVSDEQVRQKKEPVTVSEKIYLLSKLHYLMITKIPFVDSAGEITGIVSVFTDITHLVEAQEKNERTIRQTINAFVKTIEMKDPYLAGHSRMMSVVSKAVAKELGLDGQEQATVELAAYLSQVGKVFVDQAILSKPGQLTDAEKLEMQKHVQYTEDILRDIEFELPVSETICQMNENSDGSGYPQGLKGDQIRVTAKVLAVANSFCAMSRPRSYRSALAPREAIEILAKDSTRYDPAIVGALKVFISSPGGEKLLS